jgi:hypothetical protein
MLTTRREFPSKLTGEKFTIPQKCSNITVYAGNYFKVTRMIGSTFSKNHKF